jgi:hypothetical protein
MGMKVSKKVKFKFKLMEKISINLGLRKINLKIMLNKCLLLVKRKGVFYEIID